MAGCGSLPRPFEGYPGANATRLVQPPPVRLVVMRPEQALLGNDAGLVFAGALAEQLLSRDVPAVSTMPHPGDWRLVVTAENQGGSVVPSFTVFDPIGKQSGTTLGAAVPTARWAEASSQTLRDEAASSAPNIADLLSRIEATRRANDPNSLVNRPIRIRVTEVTGAPGDGNRQLSRQMRDQLAQLGIEINETTADFTVIGQVLAVPVPGKPTRIEITWVVNDVSGAERGKLVQLNEVQPGSLDRYWGDVAHVVAIEAAGGVKDVVDLQSGRRKL